MGSKIIGVVDLPGDARGIVKGIQKLETMGIPAVWLTTGAPGYDALTIFSAAAAMTKKIRMGTAVTPTWPQHPVYSVQQVQVIADLAPGRFRFGVGPSGRRGMETVFGVDFKEPVTNLREFVQVAKSLLQEGKVDFDGRHYRAHAAIDRPVPDVPVMGSALGPGAFRACGEVADGVISWLCPSLYLKNVGLPALEEGAKKAGRPTPPLIAHFIACVHRNIDEVRAAVRRDFGYFARAEFYIRMFAVAGYPEIEGTKEWSDDLIDAITFSGDEDTVAFRIRQLFDRGASEAFASLVTAGPDARASWRRTVSALSEINKTL